TVSVPSLISLHVGCGRLSNGGWQSDNWTPYTNAISGKTKVNAANCGGGVCAFTRAWDARSWAHDHLSLPSCKSPASGEWAYDPKYPTRTWSGYCWAFVFSSYYNGAKLSSGPLPNAVDGAYASNVCNCYAHLQHRLGPTYNCSIPASLI